MKFSILVVTYNPDIKKVLLTLKSVIAQDFDDYEIIISDDGSAENCFEAIEAFFQKNNFTNYILVPHEQNQGTVKNLISGLQKASGKYVRDFGPGDTFYNKNTLAKIYNFLEQEKCDACFGLMRGFYMDEDNQMKYGDFNHPFDIDAYRKPGREKRIQKNLILYSDNVSGACICYKTEFYLEYLKKIEKCVTYEEDIFQVLSSLEGKTLRLLDDYIVWYEMNNGVSARNSRFEELLRQDVEKFHQMLLEIFPDNKYVRKRKQVSVFYKINNLYLRTLLRMFVNPDSIRYLCSSALQKLGGAHQPAIVEKGFLEEPDFWK